MIIFDQLRISDDGKRMYINAHVNEATYFRDVYIDSIYIMTGDKALETYPNVPLADCIYSKPYGSDDKVKKINLVLTPNDFTKGYEKDAKKMVFTQSEMQSTLFFVYIKCGGAVSGCAPCGLDEEFTLGVTFDEKLLYQRVMNYTKQLTDDCNVPTGFADLILLWNAFKAAIETEHYIPAIKYWRMLFGTDSDSQTSLTYDASYYASPYTGNTTVTVKGCGCNG